MQASGDTRAIPPPQVVLGMEAYVSQLEIELKHAVTLENPEQTQQGINALKEELRMQRTWIAPIQLIPFEILSEIFVLCSKETRFAPMTIAAVSRHWRDVILATPQAWSRIFPQYPGWVKPTSLGYVALFLQRSAPYPLHIHIPWNRSICRCRGRRKLDTSRCDCDNVELIFQNSSRIQCFLADADWFEQFPTITFPNLTSLAISNFSNSAGVGISLDCFPALSYLDLSGCASLYRVIKLAPNRPALKCLDLVVDGADNWLDLVKSYASTLTGLKLLARESEFYRSTRRWILDCPQLEYLLLRDGITGIEVPIRLLELKTPKLAFYEYRAQPSSSKDECKEIEVLHLQEPRNLMQVQSDCLISLHQYPNLRILKISNEYDAACINVLRQLDQDLRICPKLEIIECYNPVSNAFDEVSAKRRLADRNRRTGSIIELVVVTKRNLWEKTYDYKCNGSMACRSWLGD